jgi:cytochrome c oxidase subunit II
MLTPSKIPNIGYWRVAGLTLVALVSAAAFSGCQQSPAAVTTRGGELFSTCASCHGSQGEGSYELSAPSIAGRSAQSIEAALQEFRNGFRGNHFDDHEGMRMRPMALSLDTNQDVKAVAEYIASLPPVHHSPRLDGDPKAGEDLYTGCSTCHGPDGAGDEENGIPRLAGLEDWYVARQLKKFQGGIRGFNPKDDLGPLMQAGAAPLGDDKAIQDVAAYIATLKP